jgi:ribosomal protein L7/L12
MAHTFVSYARQDSEFVIDVVKRLKAAGAAVWLDQLDIPAGQRWDRKIQDALENCNRVLAVISPRSVTSENVMDELSYALETCKPILPVLLEPCELPLRLRRLQHIRLPSGRDEAAGRLIEALNAADQQSGSRAITARSELPIYRSGSESDTAIAASKDPVAEPFASEILVTSLGSARIELLRFFRATHWWSLQEARDFLEASTQAPQVFFTSTNAHRTQVIAAGLKELGASVEVRTVAVRLFAVHLLHAERPRGLVALFAGRTVTGALQELMNIDQSEAEKLVDRTRQAPQLIVSSVTQDEAQIAVRKLNEVGAIVEMGPMN